MNFDPSLPTSYEYIHYTGENLDTIDLSRTYIQTAERLASYMPNGLWLSIAGINDWEKYCFKNNYNLLNLRYEFQVKLKPRAKILILQNTDAFENFEETYAYRWEAIIKDHQGLALPRVMPQMRNRGLWNDAWCCTSACIWDLQAVEKVEKL